MKMSNLEFISKVAYQERIHRSLHGVEHAKPYLAVLRKAATVAATAKATTMVLRHPRWVR